MTPWISKETGEIDDVQYGIQIIPRGIYEVFEVRKGLRQKDELTLMLFNFALEMVIRTSHENREEEG